MQDATKHAEENIESCVEADRSQLTPQDKKTRKEKIRKELAEKRKNLSQMLSIVPAEDKGSGTVSERKEDDDDDNDDAQSLERMTIRFKNLLSKKD